MIMGKEADMVEMGAKEEEGNESKDKQEHVDDNEEEAQGRRGGGEGWNKWWRL